MSRSSPKPLPTTTNYTNPLNNIIISEGKKIQSNLSNISTLTTELSRGNTSFYLSKDLSKSWRHYCRITGRDGCWLIEEALLEYMKNHPTQTVTINITQDLRTYTPSRKAVIQLEISKQELKGIVELISRVQQSNPANVKNFLPKLHRVVKNAIALNYQDEEIEELLDLARRFLE